MEDFVGVINIGPSYAFDGESCIISGGKKALEMGTKTIKVQLSPAYTAWYQPNIKWAGNFYHTPKELAAGAEFKPLWDMDFHTFFVAAYQLTIPYPEYAKWFRNGVTEKTLQNEYNAIYDLACWFLTEYKGSGKTFVIQNWEGDWACMDESNPEYDPSDEVFDNLIQWINVRQQAVEQARQDVGTDGVQVYNMLEVNLVQKAMRGRPTVTNNVIPHTSCDFYSYSCYELASDHAYAAALDYLRSKVEESGKGKDAQLVIGEFGLPESSGESHINADRAIRIAREKGYSHVLYWTLFSTEGSAGMQLIRKDGSYSPAGDVLYWYLNGEHAPDQKAEVPRMVCTPTSDGSIGLELVSEEGLQQIKVNGQTGAGNKKVTLRPTSDYFADLCGTFDAQLEIKLHSNGSKVKITWNTNEGLKTKELTLSNSDAWTTYEIQLEGAVMKPPYVELEAVEGDGVFVRRAQIND